MNSHVSALEKLRTALRAMPRGDLLVIAERALELVPDASLTSLLGDFVRVDGVEDASLPPAPLLEEVRKFHADSLSGRYYQDFAVNSRNFMETSKGTDAFMAEFDRLVHSCVRAADTAPRSLVRQALELLFELLRQIDEAEDEVIFFADEGGSWQVGVDWCTVLAAYFRCLAETASPEEFSATVDRVITDFAEHERPEHMQTARAVASSVQQAALDALNAEPG